MEELLTDIRARILIRYIGMRLARISPETEKEYAAAISEVWNSEAAYGSPYVSVPEELTYPDACICGRILSATGSRWRLHCSECKGKIPLSGLLWYGSCPVWMEEVALATATCLLNGKDKEVVKWLQLTFPT